jgi:hypothetical protein
MTMESSIFWELRPCSLVEFYRSLGVSTSQKSVLFSIKMGLEEAGFQGLDWIQLVHWRGFVNTAINIRIP